MPYLAKASAIIKDCIKSAVFIDEKCWEPYTSKSENDIREENLSLELYNNFKSQSISLAIHKFKKEDSSNLKTKNYLFENRDLVLLDWKLDGESGEEYSLELLADIVERSHIHFCCIYTSEEDIDNVFDNLLSYFSSETHEKFENIRLELSDVEDEVFKILPNLKLISRQRNDKSSGIEVGKLIASHKELIGKIKAAVSTSDFKCALIKCGMAFENTIKAKNAHPCPTIISYDKKVIVINNTIVTILHKGTNDAAVLIEKMSNQISGSNNSFTQLLGLEMQNVFSRKASFVDAGLLSVSKESLLFHRKQLIEQDGEDLPFKDMIKELLIEQAKLYLRTEDLSLLDDNFLNQISGELPEPGIDEMVKMNVFYNSTKLKDSKSVNFGDVFFDEQNNYYICITSACDCLRPDKINNSFYFAKGEKESKREQAIELGDTAFFSYLPNDIIVRWSGVESGIDDKLHKFKPVYIKPESYVVPNNKLDEQQSIQMLFLDSSGAAKSITTKYVTTIKPVYAQRIANHAFSYPSRVGIDFVKTKKKKEK